MRKLGGESRIERFSSKFFHLTGLPAMTPLVKGIYPRAPITVYAGSKSMLKAGVDEK